MKGCKRIEKNRAIRLCPFLRQCSLVFDPGPQMFDSLCANLEIPFASLYSTGSFPVRVCSDNAVMFPSKRRDELPQAFVNTCQKKQGKAGEQSCTDAVTPESECCRSYKHRGGWNRIVNPMRRPIKNHHLLGLLNQGGNPSLHLSRQPAYPTLNVGG